MTDPKCKWEQDEVCVNADCPVCADFCPVTNCPETCKFAEMEGQKRTNGDKIRAMTDDELKEKSTAQSERIRFQRQRDAYLGATTPTIDSHDWGNYG